MRYSKNQVNSTLIETCFDNHCANKFSVISMKWKKENRKKSIDDLNEYELLSVSYLRKISTTIFNFSFTQQKQY